MGVAVCFAWTSLVLPLAQAHAQDRALAPRSYQHDEFSTNPEDGAYFSPRRLRERMEKMDDWIQGQNSRLAYLQGRGDPGATEEYSDQVRRYSVERFFVQGEMKDELEAKRAQTSRQLAQAGGFHFKQFKDGKREWYKNGKVQRVENEKIVQNGRELRRETLDMTYDAHGNMAGYRTETRDETGRVIGTSRWEGVYTEGRRRDAKLLSFTENSWDALGNATRLDRTNIQWTADGKKTLSYTDKETDSYGRVSRRDVSDSTYNDEGQLTSYKELTTAHTGETSTKIWSDGKYEKNAKDQWSLSSYKESVTQANGRRTEREWGQAQYDEKGRLAGFSEKNTNDAGKTSTRRWEKGRYDDKGQLTSYQETVKEADGRQSFRGWEGGRYDENGRLVSYQESTVDSDGVAGWRNWHNGEYNSKNDLIGFSERSIDARGQSHDRVWQGQEYDKGQLTHSVESTTDSRGLTTKRDWTGVYGEKDRLASFTEANTDIAGQTSTRAQDGLDYDTIGRIVSYNEKNTDAFGIESRQVWIASGFDDEDRVTGYETRETSPAGEQVRRRNNIALTASGRIASYDEEVEVSGEGRTPLITKSRWSDAVYGPSGDLLSYHETTTNPAGENSSHQWEGRYDSLGRLTSYVDERQGAAGPPVTVRWAANSFDAFDHATSLTETMETNGGARERTWSGVYDKRGLVTRSLETIRAANGQRVTTQLNFAAYDRKGQLTDSDTSLRRSDMPDLVSETKVSGQTYDEAGHVTGGSEVTHLTGRTPAGAIDLTITGGTANGTFAGGKLTGYEQSKIITGTDDRGQTVHIQDVTAVTLGQHGDRADVTHHMAFDAQNRVVADKTTTSRQAKTLQDVQGRTLTATQETFDNATPDVVTTSQIKNTYGATGDVALSIEDSTDAQGVRTVRKTESLSTDAAGRALGSRTTVTRPGMTVTEEVTEQSNMAYDTLGRSAGAHEDSATTGPGLFTHSSIDRTITYDGAGNAVVTRETGDRNGVPFEMTTTNEAFTLSGQATAYREQGWSRDGGVTNTRRSGIGYNKYGQAETYRDEGIVGGQYRLNNHTALERDAHGREIRSLEEGINESGKYRYESRTVSFNNLGQATSRTESGWKAAEGNYSQVQTNIRYDASGRQMDFDQTKTLKNKTVVSHWASKGYDNNGAALGYLETGTIMAGEGEGQAFTEDQSVGATNSLGQVVSYVTLSAKTFTDGSTQTSTVNWSNGVYDDAGRLDGFFEDTTTVTTEKDGTTKTARNARERHHTTHAEESGEPNTDGAAAIRGFTSGYTETLYKNGDPAKAEQLEVTNMVYDNNGLYYDSKTLRGKTDRFKDALRGLSSMLFGTEGPLSKTGRALARLFDLTEGLIEQVGNWFENAVEGGREIFNSLLGLPSGAATVQKDEQISASSLENLTEALRKALGTNQLQNLPVDLRPAVQSFGVMDEAPLLTQRTSTLYDSQGRAVSWKEYSLTAASTKPIYSEVTATYKGTSSQMASYDAKTIDGEKITHTVRDQFTHDTQGRESYREVKFDGDDIKLLPTGQETGSLSTQDPTVSGVAGGWSSLTVSQRTALLDDIFNEKVEVLGTVDFYVPDGTEYDATGGAENMFTTHVTRGTELFNLSDKLDLAKETQQVELDTEQGIEIENQTRIAAQNKIISGMGEKINQDVREIAVGEEALADKLDRKNQADLKESEAKDALEKMEAQIGNITRQIEAYKGKEIFRERLHLSGYNAFLRNNPEFSTIITSQGSVNYREVTENQWFIVLCLNSSGQLVQTVNRKEIKTVSKMPPGGVWVGVSVSEKETFETNILNKNGQPFSADGTVLASLSNDDKSISDLLRAQKAYCLYQGTQDLGKIQFRMNGLKADHEKLDAFVRLFDDRYNSNIEKDKLSSAHKSRVEQALKAKLVYDDLSNAISDLKSNLNDDRETLSSAKIDLGNLTTSLAEGKAQKLAEAIAETTRLTKAISCDLGAFGVLLNGKTVNFSGADWESILKGVAVTKDSQRWDLVSIAANSLGKRNLKSEEHVARLAMNVAGQTQTLAWKGAMTLAGQSVDGKDSRLLKQIATLAENASAQGPPNGTPTIPGLSFAGDGHLTVTPPSTQTQDGLGRLTSQTSKTYTLSRWKGETSASVVTQTTQAYRYDSLGNVVGFDRVTSEPGKNPTHEILNSARYDAQGRQRASEITVTDETGTYKILTTNDGYDANGRPINTQRVKTQGTSVTVSKEIGSPITDDWGHTLFGASENLSTTLDAWNDNKDISTAVGLRSKGYTWNNNFNAKGDVTDSFRVTQKAFGQAGSHLIFESTHFTYNPEGSRLATSVSKVLETGRDAKTGATLFKAYTDENTVTKYSDKGQALLQTSVHRENGQTTTTVDNEVRKYDEFGRLTETSTTTTDASGQKTQNHYKAMAFDQAGRATSFERSSGHDGITTFEEKVTGATYDVNGNVLGQDSKVSEWDENGNGLKTSKKSERGNIYNLFGQLTSGVTITTRYQSNGAKVIDTKQTDYVYDLSGRAVKTTVNGQEVNGEVIKPYNTTQEIMSWDKNGRAARTRNTSKQEGVTTEKISLQDIQYDGKGRVISDRDLVHKTGEGLNKYTEESLEVDDFDSWGRAANYTQTLVDGALRTQSNISAVTYDADGLVTSQITNIIETSINSLVDLHVERTITQTGMKYDVFGNLVDYTKVVKEGDLESTFRPVLLEYDKSGHATTSLERVTDNTGRNEIVGQVGSQFNSLGQLVESLGQSMTVKAESGVLDNRENLEKLAAGIKAGAFTVDKDAEGKRLVAELGYQGVWVNQTMDPIRYDEQGRLTHSSTQMNKIGWGTIDVPVTETVFDQTVDKHDGYKYVGYLEQRKREIQAMGFEVTGTTFQWEGSSKKHRYCRATITYLKKESAVLSTHEPSSLDVKVFDALNRPLIQTATSYIGRNTTTSDQFLTYNSRGQVGEISSIVHETGFNADGKELDRSYSQKQTFAYNALGQTERETAQTWGDSQSPLKLTTTSTTITYGVKGERQSWEESTSTNDKTAVDVRRVTNATYDGLGRLSTYDAAVYEKNGEGKKLLYVDRNVLNSYDGKGRLARSISRRQWGNGTNETVALAPGTGAQATQPTDTSGQAGGGVAGLDEGWTNGNAVVTTAYQYSEDGTTISGMRVTATGTGINTNSEVQSQGIHLEYEQSNIKYDSTGRATSYHLKTTQIEHYDYFKQVQKGLKRKNARKSATEAVTTESDVQVLEFDGFGRQVHTIVESQKNDKGRSWSRTETTVKSFDEAGRVKDVDRQTQSRMTVVKGGHGFAKTLAKAAKVFPPLNAVFISSPWLAAYVASGSLGGQTIHSYTHTVARNQYKSDGTLDELATKAKTTTLEEYSYQQGKNYGDKVMQAVDISMAVAAVVLTVVSCGALAPLAFALATMAIAAVSTAYRMARQGISTHDLGMFGKNHDRAEAKQNAMAFYSGVVSVAVAGAGAWMSTVNTLTTTVAGVVHFTNTARAILVGMQVAGQMAVAKAGGADSRTMWTLAALTLATSYMNGTGTTVGSGAMTGAQQAFAIGGSLVTNIGLTYGKQSQRTTWMALGSGLSGASGDSRAIPSSVFKTFAVQLYAKKHDGSGLMDQDKINQGLITQAVGEAAGTALGNMMGIGAKLYGDKQIDQKAAALTPEQYAADQPIPKTVFKSFMIDLGAGLLSPLKALAGFAMALQKTPATNHASALAAPRQANGAENQLRNTSPQLNIEFGNNTERGVASSIEAPTTGMKREIIGKDKTIPGRAMEVIKNLPGADTIKSVPNIKPSLDLLPLPGLRLLPGLMSPRVGVWEEGSTTLAARLTDYLYQWTPGNKAITLVASAMGFNAYGEGRDYSLVGGGESLGRGFEALEFVASDSERGMSLFAVKVGETFSSDGKTWSAGTKFASTANGLVMVEGTALEKSVSGLNWTGGQSLPVSYVNTVEGLVMTGIDFKGMAGIKFEVTGKVALADQGFEFAAGSFEVNEEGGIHSLGHETVWHSIGSDTWNTVIKPSLTGAWQTWAGKLEGNTLTIENPVYKTGAGAELTLGASFTGTIDEGHLTFHGNTLTSSRVAYAHDGKRATGLASDNNGFVKLSPDGAVEIYKVKFDGDGKVKGLGGMGLSVPFPGEAVEEKVKESTSGGATALNGLIPMKNVITVTDYDGTKNVAGVHGVFMVNGEEEVGFGLMTQVTLAEGVEIQIGDKVLRQNESKNASVVTEKGLVPGNNVVVTWKGQDYIIGGEGRAEIKITREATAQGGTVVKAWTAEGNRPLPSDPTSGGMTIHGLRDQTYTFAFKKGDNTSTVSLTQGWDKRLGDMAENLSGNILKVNGDDLTVVRAEVTKAVWASVRNLAAIRGLVTGDKGGESQTVMTYSDTKIGEAEAVLSEQSRAIAAEQPGTGQVLDTVKLITSKLGGDMVTAGVSQQTSYYTTDSDTGKSKTSGDTFKEMIAQAMMVFRPDVMYEGAKEETGSKTMAVTQTFVTELMAVAFIVQGARAGWGEGVSLSKGTFAPLTTEMRVAGAATGAAKAVAGQMLPFLDEAVERGTNGVKFELGRKEFTRLGLDIEHMDLVSYDHKSGKLALNLDKAPSPEVMVKIQALADKLEMGTLHPKVAELLLSDKNFTALFSQESLKAFETQTKRVLAKRETLETDLKTEKSQAQAKKAVVNRDLRQAVKMDNIEKADIKALQKLEVQVTKGEVSADVALQKTDRILSKFGDEYRITNAEGKGVEGVGQKPDQAGRSGQGLSPDGEGRGPTEELSRSKREESGQNPQKLGEELPSAQKFREKLSRATEAGRSRETAGRSIHEAVGRLGEKNAGTKTHIAELRETEKTARGRVSDISERIRSVREDIRGLKQVGQSLKTAIAKSDPNATTKLSPYIIDDEVAVQLLTKYRENLTAGGGVDRPVPEGSTRLSEARRIITDAFNHSREILNNERGSILIPSKETAAPNQLDFLSTGKPTPTQKPRGEDLFIDTSRLDYNHKGRSWFDPLVLEKNYKKILPEDYLRLETTLKNPNRIETTVKDPVTGATIWRVENPNTKVTVDIDGKGNVLKVDVPKAPRSETPALNKSNAPRAGPETQQGNSPTSALPLKMQTSTPFLPEIPQTLRDNIGQGLGKIKATEYDGVVYRNVNTKYAHDFDSLIPSKDSRFRYNPKAEFGAGYYSETPEQTFYEIKAHKKDPFAGRTVVQAHVHAKILDLTNAKNLEWMGLSEKDITSPAVSIPIEIARQARAMGFEGIRAPQADGSGKANIILFSDKFGKDAFIKRVSERQMDLPVNRP